MRISINFLLNNNFIPKDYRRGFASFIKNALSITNKKLFEFYYEGKFKMKPFTFSVYFPDGSKYQNDGFLVGNNVVMKFTTNQIELLTTVVNGVQNISKQPYPFFNNALKLNFIRVHPLKKIDSSEIKFKTISPILVTNKNCHVDIDGKQYDLYLEPGEDGFDEGLYFLIKEQVRQLLNYDNSFPLEYEFLKESLKVVPVWHYNQWNKSIKGEIIIKSHPEILQLLYDTGIGARRSQGFGMLEVIE